MKPKLRIWLIALLSVLTIVFWASVASPWDIVSISPNGAKVPGGQGVQEVKATVLADDESDGSCLQAAGDPPGVKVTFEPVSRPRQANDTDWESTMTVQVVPEVAPGKYPIEVRLFDQNCGRRLAVEEWVLEVAGPSSSPSPSSTSSSTGPTGATSPSGPTAGESPTGPTGATGPAVGNDFVDDEVVAIPFDDDAPEEFVRPARSRFVLAVNGPDEASTDPALIVTNVMLALLMTLVVVANGTLFENTLVANLPEVKGWFGWMTPVTRGSKRIVRRLSRSWMGLAIVATITALLYGLLSPDFGIDEASIALVLGILGAILTITLVKEWTTGFFVRRSALKKAYLRVYPGTLLVGIACVAISRLVDFEPGYLWALVAMVAFRGSVGKVHGRALAIASAALLVLGVAAWAAIPPVRDTLQNSNPSFGLLVLEALLVATFVAALEGLVFGLIPLRFLDGQKVIDWNRWAWFGLFALTLFAFLHLLLNPASGYIGWSKEIPALLVVGLFAGFSIFSVSFWAYFRFRRSA